MLQPQRPIERLTHVLRAKSGLCWRPRGYGSALGTLTRAHPLTQFDAEERVRHMLCNQGLPFVAERLTEITQEPS